MLKQNLEHDKYALHIIMPNIEAMAQRAKEYTKELENEIHLFKEKINYDGVCQEIDEDMRRLGYV